METAKQILERYRDDSKFPDLTAVVFYRGDCLEAMTEYAKQTAILFAQWMANRGYEHLEGDIWKVGHLITRTTEMLYDQFLNTLNT